MFDNSLMKEYWNRSTEGRTHYEQDNVVEERELPEELEELSALSKEKFMAHWNKSSTNLNQIVSNSERPTDFPTQIVSKKGAQVMPKSLSKPTGWQTLWVIVSVIVALLLFGFITSQKH